MNISAIILTKNEGEELINCINNIQSYVDEVIIIDSSDNTSAEIISDKLQCNYYHKQLGKDNINGFSDLRNFGNFIAKNNWCLHVDVDEIFSDDFLKKIDFIIEQIDHRDPTKKYAYALPRINLPFYELYPDYQIRLMNKEYSEWIGKIHEKINIFVEPNEIIYLNEYPIIHKSINNKIETNKRWNNLNKTRNILICSLFKNSTSYLDIFLNHLNELIKYSKTKDYNIDLYFIEGNSKDLTYKRLKEWLLINCKDIRNNLKELNIPNNIDRFTTLAILRNMLIKFGLKSHHDYVLMIDSDTLPEKDLLFNLVNSLELNQCDVIAPMPFIEDFKNYNNEYFYDTLAFIDNENINFKHINPYNTQLIKKEIIKMNSVGTCYLAKSIIYNLNDFEKYNIIKCHTESIIKPLISYEGNENNIPISEQISFFNKLKKRGYQTYVDKNIKLLHINLEKLKLEWH